MNRSMEDTIMAFTEKYEGDFRRIYQAIATKERLTDEEIGQYIDDIEEPSLNNIEPASQELNLDASVQEEQGSIFGTPEMQAPAAVETNAPDPSTVEGPTLVIEDKEETNSDNIFSKFATDIGKIFNEYGNPIMWGSIGLNILLIILLINSIRRKKVDYDF